jgi:peptidyl-prolyl cis-trans isomerase SurA
MKIAKNCFIGGLVVLGAAVVGSGGSASGQAATQKAANSVVVEEIIARVNNEVITLSDFEKADQELHQEVAQDCQGCAPDKIQANYEEQKKDLLRGLIDNALLIEHGKDLAISVETDLIKQLDQVRKDNNLASMEDLQKAVEASGLAWEDYKTQMRNKLLQHAVISQEVGSRMSDQIGEEDIKKYYDEHTTEFDMPEQVVLADIFLSTDGKDPQEAFAIRQKAIDLHNRITKGEDFAQLAERYSQDSAAAQGGTLGAFKRNELSKQIEDVVFPMNKNEITDVIQVKTGFEIFKVLNHFDAGVQPYAKVHDMIQNKLFDQKMEPAMRTYLAELREESYVMTKPGYTDSGGGNATSAIQEVAPTPDAPDKKKSKKKMNLPKVNGG